MVVKSNVLGTIHTTPTDREFMTIDAIETETTFANKASISVHNIRELIRYSSHDNDVLRALCTIPTKCIFVVVCLDVDECASVNPCGTGNACINSEGSYTCTCGDGFTVAIDSSGCTGDTFRRLTLPRSNSQRNIGTTKCCVL